MLELALERKMTSEIEDKKEKAFQAMQTRILASEKEK